MGSVHRLGRAACEPLRLRAAATAALLSLFFVIVYGGTNWFTAQRPDSHIGTWYFGWELVYIPYVPILIVPYMSCDLFFVGAPFLCRDEREMQVFRNRILFSILVATAFFLLMPLTLVWPPRPRVAGLFGDFVEASCTAPFLMEFPHNLFPSLHITLSTILADLYARHTRGVVRLLLQGWFLLLGCSTILTWQHHLVDLAGGLVLAGFALYLYRDAPNAAKGNRNLGLALAYAVGAGLLLALIPAVLPWGVFLLWPAAALGLAAWAYVTGRTDLYRKESGCVPASARFALAPVLVFQVLSHRYYRGRSHAWDALAPGVLIGRALSNGEAAKAVHAGVTAVLDLTAEFTEADAFRTRTYLNLPVLDLTAPTQPQLDEAVAFIQWESASGTVYIHCKAGYSRSAAVACAWLMARGMAFSVEEAIERVLAARPSIVIRPEVLSALRVYAERTFGPSPARVHGPLEPARRAA